MLYVLASIVCSVAVSVLLKLTLRLRFDIGQAIAWNYAAAALLTLVVLHPALTTFTQPDVPWVALVALGILLPTIFLALGAAVKHAGIVRADAAQRLSLVISLGAAFVLFGQPLNAFGLAGCVLGLAAMAAMVWRRGSSAAPTGAGGWAYPALVFAGFGAIDVLFKRVAAVGVPLGDALVIAFVLALLVAFAIELARRARFTARSSVAGIALGLLNFGNIYFYLSAHRALPANPALVFASMNLGVVLLGALTGLLVFREKLARVNLAGLAAALVAVGLLVHG